MLGRDTRISGTKTAQIAPPPPGSVPSSAGKSRIRSDPEATSFMVFPFVLIVAVALYFVWALLEQHQKLKTAIEPKAIAINARNLLVIMVTVVLGLNLFKIGAVKISALLAQLTGGRIRARWLVYLAGGA